MRNLSLEMLKTLKQIEGLHFRGIGGISQHHDLGEKIRKLIEDVEEIKVNPEMDVLTALKKATEWIGRMIDVAHDEAQEDEQAGIRGNDSLQKLLIDCQPSDIGFKHLETAILMANPAPNILEELDRLTGEVAACWGIEEVFLRESIGNTNYQVVLDRLEASRVAIAKAGGRK